jgi:tight adherence protein C
VPLSLPKFVLGVLQGRRTSEAGALAMDAIFDLLPLAENPALMMSVVVFAAASTIAFGFMAAIRVRGDVRRRAAGIGIEAAAPADGGSRSLRYASVKAAQQLIDYTNRYFSPAGDGELRKVRRQLIQAGFLDPRAGAFFFLARVVMAVLLTGAAFMLAPYALSGESQWFWPFVWGGGLIGYLSPKLYVDRRIAKRQNEHRAGFPDFMDLLVVCADAGLSMEAALDRVGRELADSYPSLSSNIYMTTLEIRAGRTMSEALDHFADRLGLAEARSFATLLQQSEELGSSLTEALRVYSDDMRHKRMSIAEEKAYALPAKLSVPLIMCIFPVIIIVILLPVYVRFKFSVF